MSASPRDPDSLVRSHVLLRWVRDSTLSMLLAAHSRLSTSTGFRSITSSEHSDQFSLVFLSVFHRVPSTTPPSLCGSGWLFSFSHVSDSSVLETSCNSITKITPSSGTRDTTWCSLLTSCTTASLPITSRSTTSSPSRWWSATRLPARRSSLSAIDNPMRSSVPSTSQTLTTSTSPSEPTTTSSEDSRPMASSEEPYQFCLQLSASFDWHIGWWWRCLLLHLVRSWQNHSTKMDNWL